MAWRPISHAPDNMRRASGEVVCERCHYQYYEHPTYRELTDSSGHLFLTLACDGSLLKL